MKFSYKKKPFLQKICVPLAIMSPCVVFRFGIEHLLSEEKGASIEK